MSETLKKQPPGQYPVPGSIMGFMWQTLARLGPTILLLMIPWLAGAQSIIDELDASPTTAGATIPSLATETIKKISPSKRVFVITNENNSFDKGDFISLVLDTKLVARAVSARMREDLAGIKVVKIYSLALWNLLREGRQIQIVRGDDSYFRTKKEEAKQETGMPEISEEEDLFNSTLLEDTVTLEEDKKRVIKTDNIVSVGYGQVEGVDDAGASTRYSQLNGSWGFQIEDNIWIEGLYGQNVVRDFPSPGLDTKLTNLTFRAKYAISAPFLSFIKPYVGYQIINTDSPGAGEQNPDDPVPEEQLAEELELLDQMKKNSFIFGVTWLKRLVPGWFVRVDLGSDILGAGFSLEF